MKIAIVTLGDKKVKPWNDVSFPNKLEYCKHHGYDFISSDHLLDDRPPGWSKIPLLLQHLDDYDYLFWSDTDSLIVQPHIRLEDLLVPMPDLIFCMGGTKGKYWTLNSGEFFVKNSSWARGFLNTVYAQEFLVNTPTDRGRYVSKTKEDEQSRQKCGCSGCKWFKYDQKAFIHVLHHMSDSEKRDHVVCYEPDNISYFNGYGQNYKEGCFIHHFPGKYKNYRNFTIAAKSANKKLQELKND